jgi:DNA-binding transcriptional ArsR family regulator
MKTDYAQLKAEILSAIAHENRIKIVEILADGPKSACEIAPALRLEQTNLSRHMKVLIQAGIVNHWKDGRKSMYEISDKNILKILEMVTIILKNKTRDRIKILEI